MHKADLQTYNEKRLEESLQSPLYGLHALELKVIIRDGVITLLGKVRTYPARERAGDVAKLLGDMPVLNRIQVG